MRPAPLRLLSPAAPSAAEPVASATIAPAPAVAPDAGGPVSPAAAPDGVAPASDLVPASGDLQPRERADRLASDAQRQSIAANLDPARLMRAPEADRGAPIVGPDNVIESGNGRVQAIQRAAEQNPSVYARYVQALQDAGHDTAGIDTPVLVARRTSDLSPADRQAFVQEANQSATQRMSAPEQARVDGAALTSPMLAKYDPSLPATSAGNPNFVRDWVSTLPEADRNSVMDAQGQLSGDGQRRLNGAMLARAYGDKGVLARGLEGTDDATRSVSGGMADAAPAWAQLRAGIEGGTIPPEFDRNGIVRRRSEDRTRRRAQGDRRTP